MIYRTYHFLKNFCCIITPRLQLHTFNTDELSRKYQASSEITNGTQYFSDMESEVSSEEQTLENEYCSGCGNHCPLSQPRCKRGVMMQQKFLRK